MPDIQLRFHKDMLVLSGQIDASLAQRGLASEQECESLLVSEPETVLEPLRLHTIAGAACLVLPTANITRARLAHMRLEGYQSEIARSACSLAAELAPQHVLAEIGPSGLPLDGTSKTSMTANAEQYAGAARAFEGLAIDGFFINDMASVDDLRCAIEGVRKVSVAPLFASVNVDEAGKLFGDGCTIEDALAAMEEHGASVAGIQTTAAPVCAAGLAARMAQATSVPLLVQLAVAAVHTRDPYDNSPYWCADLMVPAAQALHAAGVQFLRATGAASASYTGALAAATFGLDVAHGQGVAYNPGSLHVQDASS